MFLIEIAPKKLGKFAENLLEVFECLSTVFWSIQRLEATQDPEDSDLINTFTKISN